MNSPDVQGYAYERKHWPAPWEFSDGIPLAVVILFPGVRPPIPLIALVGSGWMYHTHRQTGEEVIQLSTTAFCSEIQH
jgi:hypothetical protein